MSVGIDIKDVLAEIGTSFSILRPNSGEYAAEYLDYESNSQVTKPFIREHFLEAILPYDTNVIAGDIIRFSDDREFIVMNSSPENLFDESIGKEAVLYKCNVSGEILRASGEVRDSNYRVHTVWISVKDVAYGLLTPKMFGTDLLQDELAGQIDIQGLILYVPSNYEIKMLDRYRPSSGEFYKVEVIEKRQFESVDVCHLVEDTRE